MNEAVILENVDKSTPDGLRAVCGASLSLGERERALVRGAPGSGKTALMRLIAGMDAPDEGRVFVFGNALHAMGADERAAFRGRSVGVCLGEPCLMPSLTVLENAALPLALRGAPKAEREKAAMAQLRALGIDYAARALPAQLKPFELRLAALARALAAKPRLLLLRDMAAGLPEGQARRFDDILRAVLQYAGAAVMFFAAGRCDLPADKRFLMERGTIREE
jgi:putative ABC transport system ATP-binding protein